MCAVLWVFHGEAEAEADHEKASLERCDCGWRELHANGETEKEKVLKRQIKLRKRGLPCIAGSLLSSLLLSPPLSSTLLLSPPLSHTQQPQCYGSDAGLGGQTGSAPLPPLCAYVNGEAEKERGESYF